MKFVVLTLIILSTLSANTEYRFPTASIGGGVRSVTVDSTSVDPIGMHLEARGGVAFLRYKYGIQPTLGYHFNRVNENSDHYMSGGCFFIRRYSGSIFKRLQGKKSQYDYNYRTVALGGDILVGGSNEDHRVGGRVAFRLGFLTLGSIEFALQKLERIETQFCLILDIGAFIGFYNVEVG